MPLTRNALLTCYGAGARAVVLLNSDRVTTEQSYVSAY